MSISDSGVTIQKWVKSSLVVEVKEIQDSDPMLLELKGTVHNQRVEVFSQGEIKYFATMVDYVFLMWVN